MPFLDQLKQGTNYTYTFTRGDNNTDGTGILFLKVNKQNKVTTADPSVLQGTTQNPDNLADTPANGIDGIVILVSPSVDAAAQTGTFTITVTNSATQTQIVPTKQFTGDQTLFFQCVP